MRVNAMNETFEDVTVFGHPMIFTCLRIDPGTVPKGLYMYEVRHDDEGRGDRQYQDCYGDGTCPYAERKEKTE